MSGLQVPKIRLQQPPIVEPLTMQEMIESRMRAPKVPPNAPVRVSIMMFLPLS